MSSGSVATYYDRLGRWTRLARVFGFGGGVDTLTVHRALADPGAGGRPTFTRLHDLLLAHVPEGASPRVLDAGCGLGGTMLSLAERRGATCTGVTLSASQAAAANDAASRAGVAARVQALVRSYDDPPPGPFDVIVAIESLAHSADPSRSVSALASVLAPSGVMVIVDDMPEPTATSSADLVRFKDGWSCPVLASESDHVRALMQAGLQVASRQDLTESCRPRSSVRIALWMALNRCARAIVPSPGFAQVMDSYLGGLALERLTRDGLMHYRMLVASKPELRVS